MSLLTCLGKLWERHNCYAWEMKKVLFFIFNVASFHHRSGGRANQSPTLPSHKQLYSIVVAARLPALDSAAFVSRQICVEVRGETGSTEETLRRNPDA